MGQFYLVLRKSTSQQISDAEIQHVESPKISSDELIQEAPKHDKVLESKLEKERNSVTERYQLMETYAQDKLKDTNVPFKRILFWNEVRQTSLMEQGI